MTRLQHTHRADVYREVDTGETDSLGDPITGFPDSPQWSFAVHVAHPEVGGAGAIEIRQTGARVIEQLTLTADHPDALEVQVGDHVELTHRGLSADESPTGRYVIERVNRASGRSVRPAQVVLSVTRLEE